MIKRGYWLLGSGDDFHVAGAKATVGDIVAHTAVENIDILLNYADIGAGISGHVAHINVVDLH